MGRTIRRGPTFLVGILAATLLTLVLASPASAHDPIFLTEDQVSPETGPYLPDGSISFAIYGSLLEPGDTRGLEFDLRDGDDLYLSLLIPDLAPEIDLADDDLPTMTLVDPDGAERVITADIREPFADPFSGTDYVTLYETVEPVSGGRYSIVVTGAAPTRFVVAVGTKEEFFTPTERSGDRPSSFPGIAAPLNAWYTTPADGSEPVNGDAAGEDVDIDVDLIEEELANLEDAEQADGADNTGEAEQADGVDSDEAAGATSDSDSGGTTWVAPIAVAIVAALGAVFFFRRRSAA